MIMIVIHLIRDLSHQIILTKNSKKSNHKIFDIYYNQV